MNESNVLTIQYGGKEAEREGQSHLLRQAGYRVLEASSEAETLRLADQKQPVLLILNSDNDERLRTLADSAPALIWMNGRDECEFINKAFLDFLGVPDVDVRGFDWAYHVHPDDRKGYVTAYLEAVVDRGLFEATFRLRRHDGQYRWMKSVGTPRFGPGGDFLGYVGSTIDVTELQSRAGNNPTPGIAAADRKGALHQQFRTVSRGLASATACIAGLVLVGWAFDITLLTSISSSFMSMKITTAVGFLCAAGSVLLFNTRRSRSHSGAKKALGIASVTFAVPAVLLGFGTLLGYVTGLARGPMHPGWMAQATAGCFVLLGVALMFANRQGPVSQRLSQYPALLVLGIAGVALVGYLYDKDSLYAVGPTAPWALHTTLSFVLLSTALLCAQPDRGLMATLSSGEPGAVMMRRMLPLTVSLLVINGWIRLAGEHNGWFDQHFGLTLLVGLNVAGFSLILWSAARSLNRTESALRESEARLQAILDRAPAAVFIKDAEGRSLFMNEYCAKVLGVDARAANGKMEYELFPRDLADQFRANDAQVWKSGKLSVLEEYIPSMEGLRTYLSQKFLLYDPQGTPYALCGIATDITERKLAEKQLWDAHALTDTILSTAPIGFALLDRQLRYLRINKALADINGLPIESHIGRHVAEIVPTLAETVREVTDRIVATGEAVKDHEFSGETPSAPGVARYWNESWYPVHDETGTLIGFGVVAEEITTRKQSEEAVRESELRFRALTERIGDVFWISDPINKKLVYVSQAFADVWGRGLQELHDRFELWLDAVHEDDRVRVGASFFEHIYDGTYDVEYRVVRPDGSFRWVRDRGRPLGIKDLVAGVAEDITERKQGEEALRRSEERWQLAVTGSTDGIWDWDIAGHTVFLSSRWKEMRGYREGEMGVDETEWSSRIHPEDYSRVMTTVQAYLKKDLPDFHCEYRTRCKDGTYLWIVDRGIAIWDERGQAIRMVGSETDITLRKQAEEQLREKEERLRVLTTAMPQLVWACSNIGECIYQSPQWQTVTGQSATDSLKFGWTEMIHPEDRVRTAEEWRTTMAQGTTYQTVYRLYMKDGTYRWYLARAEPLRDESGALVQWIGTSTDIDESKRTEAALRQSEERLRLATQAAAVGIWEWNVKTKQVRWDAQMFKIYQVAGTADGFVPYDTWRHAVLPDDLPEQERVLWETIRTRGSSSRHFRIHRYGDGDVRHIEAVETVRIDGQGETEWVVGTNIDVTERKLAEQALRESQERLEGLVDSAMDAVIAIDEQLGIVLFNPAAERMFGCSAGEVLGSSIDRFIPEASRAAHRGHVDEFGRTGDTARRMGMLGAVSGLRANGEEFPIEASISSMITRGRRLFTVILRDITDRQRAERALRGAQERLQRWNVELEQTVNVKTAELQQSQDRLRALATELNLAEQRERKRLATELHDHLQQMLVVGKIAIGQGKRVAVGIPACETAFQRVDSILSDALTYSRTLVAELCPPVLHEHGLVAGLKWLAEHMKNRQEQTVTVIAPEDHELRLAEDQRVLLFQSIRELLINAAKHAGTGEATVVLIERADQIQIEVRDQGRGFDLAAAAAAAGTPSGGISSKFGLFSIQERMRAIGGSFEIQSSPGLGTTATLVLPLEKKPLEPLHALESLDKHAAPLASAHSRGPRIRVLLVDDHIMVRQGLRAILDAYADIELVAEAGDGKEAVRLVDQLQPAVVVMDVNMPNMNGIEATELIKMHCPDTIVIGISVNAATENQELMTRAGAVGLLTKEAAVEQLYGVIQEAVKKGQRV